MDCVRCGKCIPENYFHLFGQKSSETTGGCIVVEIGETNNSPHGTQEILRYEEYIPEEK